MNKRILKRYLVNDKYKFICCPIPKVANGSIRRWYLHTIGLFKENGGNGWKYIRKHTDPPSKDLLCSGDYYKFVFIRNPFRRLVSGFLNKFLVANYIRTPATSVIEAVCKRYYRPVDFDKGITFREFVDYLYDEYTNNRLEYFNHHWLPQSYFTSGVKWDFVGMLEDGLENQIRDIEKKLHMPSFPVPLPVRNYHKYSDSDLFMADKYCDDIRDFSSFPMWKYFYDDNMIRKMLYMYASDFDSFTHGIIR